MAEHSVMQIQLLTKAELAEKLVCSTKTIERRVKAGMFSPVEGTGGKYGRPRFNPMDIPALRKLLSL